MRYSHAKPVMLKLLVEQLPLQQWEQSPSQSVLVMRQSPMQVPPTQKSEQHW